MLEVGSFFKPFEIKLKEDIEHVGIEDYINLIKKDLRNTGIDDYDVIFSHHSESHSSCSGYSYSIYFKNQEDLNYYKLCGNFKTVNLFLKKKII